MRELISDSSVSQGSRLSVGRELKKAPKWRAWRRREEPQREQREAGRVRGAEHQSLSADLVRGLGLGLGVGVRVGVGVGLGLGLR